MGAAMLFASVKGESCLDHIQGSLVATHPEDFAMKWSFVPELSIPSSHLLPDPAVSIISSHLFSLILPFPLSASPWPVHSGPPDPKTMTKPSHGFVSLSSYCPIFFLSPLNTCCLYFLAPIYSLTPTENCSTLGTIWITPFLNPSLSVFSAITGSIQLPLQWLPERNFWIFFAGSFSTNHLM